MQPIVKSGFSHVANVTCQLHSSESFNHSCQLSP